MPGFQLVGQKVVRLPAVRRGKAQTVQQGAHVQRARAHVQGIVIQIDGRVRGGGQRLRAHEEPVEGIFQPCGVVVVQRGRGKALRHMGGKGVMGRAHLLPRGGGEEITQQLRRTAQGHHLFRHGTSGMTGGEPSFHRQSAPAAQAMPVRLFGEVSGRRIYPIREERGEGRVSLFAVCLGGRGTPRSAVDARKAPSSPGACEYKFYK